MWDLQFVLPVTWSYGQKYGVTLEQMALWWSERPAKLAGQKLKVISLSTVDSKLQLDGEYYKNYIPLI